MSHNQFTTWKHVGNGQCYACPSVGNLFRRDIDSPQLMHCADCRGKINAAHASRFVISKINPILGACFHEGAGRVQFAGSMI